jgi:predicted CXXCH cytochrome family protein
MSPLKAIKVLTIAGWVLGATLSIVSHTRATRVPESDKNRTPPAAADTAKDKTADYIGSETCKACHEDQFKNFIHTAHAKLENNSSWKGKVVGCESCHGPGKAHSEEGDPTKIISFKNKSSKTISETCLACHSGKEEHNNFRRGEHWRNDVGCTDCHTAHEAQSGANKPGSNTFISQSNSEKQGISTIKLLKVSEPQLCMQCHTEVKHQFNQPFHHKVLEGAMKCTDCHNAHGGFESKQTRLATGADAGCVKCHADKQGPFVYEHAPVKTEGCASCHTPHGSSNPRLLRTSAVAQLCLECHSVDHGVGAVEPGGPQHNLNLQYKDCTACHVKIHGSHISPVFFK